MQETPDKPVVYLSNALSLNMLTLSIAVRAHETSDNEISFCKTWSPFFLNFFFDVYLARSIVGAKFSHSHLLMVYVC